MMLKDSYLAREMAPYRAAIVPRNVCRKRKMASKIVAIIIKNDLLVSTGNRHSQWQFHQYHRSVSTAEFRSPEVQQREINQLSI
jgi:hypothetical protein